MGLCPKFGIALTGLHLGFLLWCPQSFAKSNRYFPVCGRYEVSGKLICAPETGCSFVVFEGTLSEIRLELLPPVDVELRRSSPQHYRLAVDFSETSTHRLQAKIKKVFKRTLPGSGQDDVRLVTQSECPK